MHLVGIAVNASEIDAVGAQNLTFRHFGIRDSVIHSGFGSLLRNAFSVYNYKH